MQKAAFEVELTDEVAEFRARPRISTWVRGTIINSIGPKERQQKWKRMMAAAIKRERGGARWNPDDLYAIALEFRFHPANHGNLALDVENFVKPVVDAFAGGLFVEPGMDLEAIERWDFPDSNFRTLLIHRADDPPSRDREGVHIFVSVRRP